MRPETVNPKSGYSWSDNLKGCSHSKQGLAVGEVTAQLTTKPNSLLGKQHHLTCKVRTQFLAYRANNDLDRTME